MITLLRQLQSGDRFVFGDSVDRFRVLTRQQIHVFTCSELHQSESIILLALREKGSSSTCDPDFASMFYDCCAGLMESTSLFLSEMKEICTVCLTRSGLVQL